MRKHKKQGFTIPEILISTVIIGLSIAALTSSVGGIFKADKNAQTNSNVTDEQEGISSLVEAMSQSQAAMALCPAPHPFYAIKNDGTVGCDPTFDATKLPLTSDTAVAMLKATGDLLDLTFQWHSSDEQRNNPSAPLSQQFFNDKIKPKLDEAKCSVCHAGSAADKDSRRQSNSDADFLAAFPNEDLNRLATRPAVYNLDFSSYNDLSLPTTVVSNGTTSTKPAEVSRAVLSSKLTQYILRPTFQFDEVLMSSKNQGIKTTVNISTDTIQVKKSPYFPYSLSLGGQTSGTCVRSKLHCTNESVAPIDMMVESSCKASCTHQTINWCSCGKDCTQPCPGLPYVCDAYKWDWTCLSSAAVFPGTRSGFAGGVGQDQSTTFKSVPDADCLSAQNTTSERWCQKQGLICATGEPTDAVPICMQQNTCMRRCVRVMMDTGSSCGKDCFIPPKAIGCDENEYQYTCTSKATKPMNIMKFELDTRFIDMNSLGVKSLKSAGVIQ